MEVTAAAAVDTAVPVAVLKVAVPAASRSLVYDNRPSI